MTDFDSRARSAARAVHDLVASDDAPAVDTVAVPPRQRGTARALFVAAAVVLVVAIVGAVVATNRDDGPTAAEVTAFCDAATGALGSSGGFGQHLVDLAPEGLRADAEIVAKNGNIPNHADAAFYRSLETSASRLLAWIGTNCYPAAAQPGAAPADQRFAPVPLPDGTRPCFVTNGNAMATGSARQAPSRVTVYGEPQRSDPWSGPLVAVVVGHDAEQVLVDNQQIDVPGITDPTSGPMADLSYRPIAGTRVIAWTDETPGGDSVAVLARNGATVDLPTVAAQVVHDQGTYRLPTPPAGMHQIYDGELPRLTRSALGGGLGTTFSVVAGSPSEPPSPWGASRSGEMWSGAVGSQAQVDVTRLLLADTTTRTIGDRTVLEWDGNPEVSGAGANTSARWVEPGGVVLDAAVAGADATIRQRKLTELVTSMRRLTRDEWTALTQQFSYCGALATLGGAEAHSETSSGSVAVSGTSSTSVVAETPTTTITGPSAP